MPGGLVVTDPPLEPDGRRIGSLESCVHHTADLLAWPKHVDDVHRRVDLADIVVGGQSVNRFGVWIHRFDVVAVLQEVGRDLVGGLSRRRGGANHCDNPPGKEVPISLVSHHPLLAVQGRKARGIPIYLVDHDMPRVMPADLTLPELTRADVLELEDDRFAPETVVIVTGAASGIGRATAVALACNGLTVVGADVDVDGLHGTEDLATDLEAPGRVVSVRTDLTDPEAIERLVDIATDEGALRFVANIAGVQHIASIPEFPLEAFDTLLDVMLRAPFLVAKHAMPAIREHGGGAIANMCSVHGHYATQDKPAYIAAKHGLLGLTRSIAAEGDGSVRSFSVSVGYVLTPLMRDQIAESAAERGISETEVIEDVMLGQARTTELMAPVEVANLFTFGFSRHSRHLNGGDMRWDGGFTSTYE